MHTVLINIFLYLILFNKYNLYELEVVLTRSQAH